MAFALPREALNGVLIGFALSAAVIAYGFSQGGDAPTQGTAASASILIEKNTTSAPTRADWNDHSEKNEHGRLPVITNGVRVFDVYKRPVNLPPRLVGEAAKPRLAVILTNVGYNKDRSEAALKTFNADTALALPADAPYADDIAEQATNTGRELWVAMPSDSVNSSADSSRSALGVRAPANANVGLLLDTLAKLQNYVGITLASDSAVASTMDDLDPVIQELGRRGLGFARLSPAPSLSVNQSTANAKVPLVPSAYDVSTPPIAEYVTAKLNGLSEALRSSGSALLAVDGNNPVVVNTVKAWLDENSGSFDIVPPSALTAPAAP